MMRRTRRKVDHHAGYLSLQESIKRESKLPSEGEARASRVGPALFVRPIFASPGGLTIPFESFRGPESVGIIAVFRVESLGFLVFSAF
jgi:hypothetical protein